MRDPSVLLGKTPPYVDKATGEAALWWAVIKQAAYDLRFGNESLALDALEFLRESGQWICLTLFGIPREEYRLEITGLVLRRNRHLGTELPIRKARVVDEDLVSIEGTSGWADLV